MDSVSAGPRKPKFRDGVSAAAGSSAAEITFGDRRCAFDFASEDAPAVGRFLMHLQAGGRTPGELVSLLPEICDEVPHLLTDFDNLRLLTESDPPEIGRVRSGLQLYREVRRVADRTVERVARSSFQSALLEGRATPAQLIGYALEYYVLVAAAPGLIAPALATAHTPVERALIQDFLRSELGHDRFLASALKSVGVSQTEMDLHQPLPATFALCASLGVYARQHPLSFKACLFLFERAQPAFIAAFDDRCRELGLPEAFYMPLRKHAELNDEYDHEDISRSLMELEGVVDAESCTVVMRHVSIMVETMVRQEEQILACYGAERDRIPRLL